jgi:dihydroflavonol-4-reductase
MSRCLVTGATGFVGSHVARALVERGDAVRVTVRATSPSEPLEGLDAERVNLPDVTDRRALRHALKSVERVFHVAGTTNLRLDAAEARRVNAEGTRVVLEEALRADVQRVVHTSSVAAIGPAAPHSTLDERAPYPGHLGLPYPDSKHAAEVEALRIGAHGLPVVIVNPAHVFGPGDWGPSSTDVVRRFLLRRIRAYVGGAINIVDVRDVAAGHLLADERGQPGERYILGNRNYTWDRLFAELAHVSGVEPPAVRMPHAVALALAESARLPLPGRPPVIPAEVRAAAHWWTYRNGRARRELGWSVRSHEETVEETVRWWMERLGDRVTGTRQPVPLRVAGAASRAFGGLRGWLSP